MRRVRSLESNSVWQTICINKKTALESSSCGLCTRSGNRTRTRFRANRILSPACLPVPPSERMIMPGALFSFKLKSLPGREGIWSERRDSNSRPRPWQGRALPTELLSHFGECKYSQKSNSVKHFLFFLKVLN